jgi:uncharacterized protein YjbI with pentapeptide repeats
LKNVEAELFKGLKNLAKIDFSNHQLIELDLNIFKGLKRLNEVKFKAADFVKKTISETDFSSPESSELNCFDHDYIDHNDDSYEEENINKEIE